MNNYQIIIFIVLFFWVSTSYSSSDNYEVNSPDNKIKVVINTGNELNYSVVYRDNEIILKRKSDLFTISSNIEKIIEFNETIILPEPWSAETPNLNALMIALQSNGRPVQVINQKVASRSVELVNGQMLVNCKPIDLIKLISILYAENN